MYQKIDLIGNVGKPPELRNVNGTDVANFSLAVNETWNNAAGQRQEKTTWFECSVWGKLAPVAHKYLAKGKQVFVTGTVGGRAYIDKQGNPQCVLDIRVAEFKMLGAVDGNRSGGNTGGGQAPAGNSSGQDSYSWMDVPGAGETTGDKKPMDDIPF